MNCLISKNYGMLKIALAAIVWSTQGWLVKAIPWSAISLTGLRALFVAILLALLRKNVKWELNKASCLGAISVALTSTLYIAANKLTTAANAVVLQYAMPLFVIGLTWFFRKKRPTRRDVGTVFFILIGIVLCFLSSIGTGRVAGDLLALLSAGTYSIMFFLAQNHSKDPLQFIYQGMCLCAFGIFYLPIDEYFVLSGSISLHFGLAVLVLFIGYWLFASGMKDGVNAIHAAILANLEPILSPVLTFIMVGEQPGVLTVLGMAIVLVAVSVYSILEARSQEKKSVPEVSGSERKEEARYPG